MGWTLEFSAAAERDFELIFDHLFESYQALGENTLSAFQHAQDRILDIRKAAERILIAPHRGESHGDLLPGLRHLTMDRAIYWFTVDDDAEAVRVLAVFFGGQDHQRRMLIRLL